jgi:histidine ammonia-lyase
MIINNKDMHRYYDYADIVGIARKKNIEITLTKSQIKNIKLARQLVEKCCEGRKPIYGINTGVGALATRRIPKKDLLSLQYKIVKSHAVGLGEPLPKEISRAVLFLLINALSKGHSGVRLKLIEFLINLLNQSIIPVIPSLGSLGASGDLSPMAHLSLVVLGKGQVWFDNKICETKKIFKALYIKPLRLQEKEGLSLINGTYVMTAIACFNLYEAKILLESADVISAVSLEALKGSVKPFSEKIQNLKPHCGQNQSAINIRKLLEKSAIIKSHCHCNRVQDPYSLRCISHVHGDCYDIFRHTAEAVNIEINSITDNPIIIGYDGPKDILSGGNFHGQRLSSVMRYLAGALTNLSAISERRINKLLDGSQKHLPKFLIRDNGLNSGLMMVQYSAASLVADSKTLCPSMFVENIDVSAGQEDFVSMGMSPCQRVREICKNTADVLAIELFCATQGLEFVKQKPGIGVKKVYDLVRKKVQAVEQDRIMNEDIKKISEIIRNNELRKAVNSVSQTNVYGGKRQGRIGKIKRTA